MNRTLFTNPKKKIKYVKDKNPMNSKQHPFRAFITHEPSELITIDHFHLDQPKGGYKYVLVVVDHFSKFAQAFATKNNSGRTATDLLRSCRPEVFYKKGVLRNFAKFTGKHL